MRQDAFLKHARQPNAKIDTPSRIFAIIHELSLEVYFGSKRSSKKANIESFALKFELA